MGKGAWVAAAMVLALAVAGCEENGDAADKGATAKGKGYRATAGGEPIDIPVRDGGDSDDVFRQWEAEQAKRNEESRKRTERERQPETGDARVALKQTVPPDRMGEALFALDEKGIRGTYDRGTEQISVPSRQAAQADKVLRGL